MVNGPRPKGSDCCSSAAQYILLAGRTALDEFTRYGQQGVAVMNKALTLLSWSVQP